MNYRMKSVVRIGTLACAAVLSIAAFQAAAEPVFYTTLSALPSQAQARCQALTQVNLEHAGDAPARITSAQLVTGRPATAQHQRMFEKRGRSQGAPVAQMDTFPDHCRVEGYITPNIRFMMMLPAAQEAWNHRFLLASCDGFCGRVSDEIVVPGLSRGYATMTNDGGHSGLAPFDPIWGFNNRDAEIDFGYRGNHVSAQIGKAITEAYFGEAPSYSYATGFSRGGSQGLMSAQRYPEDFDGILVKAPVVEYQAINSAHFQWVANAVYPDGHTPIMDSTKVPLIHAAAIAACDTLDGLEDGVIDDPRVCTFDPGVLACQPGQPDSECLTPPQVEAVRRLYALPVNARGQQTYPDPQEIGSENDWPRFIFPEPNQETPAYAHWAGDGFLRYMAFDRDPGPNYDPRQFEYNRERGRMRAMGRIWDANSPDLRAFRDRGGRMIVVHGWGDGAVSPRMTIRYWDRMTAFMGGRDAVSEFAQFYLVPGMKHGNGGDGPYIYDALAALERWVEQGNTPDHLLLSDPQTPDTEGHMLGRTRPTYPYPLRARYDGSGSPNDSQNFAPFDPTTGR